MTLWWLGNALFILVAILGRPASPPASFVQYWRSGSMPTTSEPP